MTPGNQSRDEAVGAHYANREKAESYARLYDGSGPVSRFLNSRLHLVSQTLASVPGGDLLDVGCGPGVFVRHLLDARPGDFQITAVDRSEPMIRACAARIAGSHYASAVVGRCEALPFPDQCFDVVLGMGVLEYADLERALGELARVIRLDGRVIVTMHNPRSPYRLVERRVYGPLRRWASRARSVIRIRGPKRTGRSGAETQPVDEATLHRSMTRAGLAPVSTAYYDVTFTVPPLSRYLQRRDWRNDIGRTIGHGWTERFGTAFLTVATRSVVG